MRHKNEEKPVIFLIVWPSALSDLTLSSVLRPKSWKEFSKQFSTELDSAFARYVLYRVIHKNLHNGKTPFCVLHQPVD